MSLGTASFRLGLIQPGTINLWRHSSAAASLRRVLSNELDGIRDAGTWKKERVITSPQAASIRVQKTHGDILNFCANNYLGLSVRSHALFSPPTNSYFLLSSPTQQ